MADVCSTGWNQGGVQPDDKMVNVLALSLDDRLGIRRGNQKDDSCVDEVYRVLLYVRWRFAAISRMSVSHRTRS